MKVIITVNTSEYLRPLKCPVRSKSSKSFYTYFFLIIHIIKKYQSNGVLREQPYQQYQVKTSMTRHKCSCLKDTVWSHILYIFYIPITFFLFYYQFFIENEQRLFLRCGSCFKTKIFIQFYIFILY